MRICAGDPGNTDRVKFAMYDSIQHCSGEEDLKEWVLESQFADRHSTNCLGHGDAASRPAIATFGTIRMHRCRRMSDQVKSEGADASESEPTLHNMIGSIERHDLYLR
jgi:hypothetical protein